MSASQFIADAGSIAERIAELIRDGTVAPGQRLPSERVLAMRFGVGRPAVREALHALERGGIISTHGRRGSFVNHFRPDVLVPADLAILARHMGDEDLLHALEARRAVETALAGLAAARRTGEQLRAMELNLERMGAAVTSDGDTVGLDIEFHGLVADAAGNPILAGALQSISSLLRRSREITSRTQSGPGKALAFHLGVYRGIAAGDAAAARAAMEQHLDDVERLLRGVLGADGDVL